MIPAQFDYLAPSTVQEAVAALAEHGDDAKVLAGGQSLLPILRMRLNAPGVVIDLGRIAELQGISEDGDHLVIGAMTTYAAVLASEAVSTHAGLLSKAIQTVADGGSLVQPAVTQRLLSGLEGLHNAFVSLEQPDPLTDRETEILRLMAGGFSNKEIANSLGVAEGTVKNHVSNILSKLGVRDRTRAVLKAFELKLV